MQRYERKTFIGDTVNTSHSKGFNATFNDPSIGNRETPPASPVFLPHVHQSSNEMIFFYKIRRRKKIQDTCFEGNDCAFAGPYLPYDLFKILDASWRDLSWELGASNHSDCLVCGRHWPASSAIEGANDSSTFVQVPYFQKTTNKHPNKESTNFMHCTEGLEHTITLPIRNRIGEQTISRSSSGVFSS